MTPLGPVVAIVLQLAPWLGSERAREVARPIAEVVSSLDDAALLAVVARRESDFMKAHERCEKSGDNGQAWTMFQLHRQHWGPGGLARVCRDPRYAAWRTLQALGRGTAAERLTRFMGRPAEDAEIRTRVELYERARAAGDL